MLPVNIDDGSHQSENGDAIDLFPTPTRRPHEGLNIGKSSVLNPRVVLIFLFKQYFLKVRMQVQVVQHQTVTVLQASGSLDSLSADNLTQVLDAQILAGNTRLVVDLAAVHYTSSAGLRSLLMALKGARRVGGDLRLGAAQPNVTEVLSLAGFTSIIKTFDTVQAAITSYAA